MGNGPSLLKSDLNQLADEITIVSNAHFLIWEQLSYIPSYLTVEDRLVAEDRATELQGLQGIQTLFPFDLYDILGPATPDRLFVNFPRAYARSPRFSWDLSKRAFWGGTVSFLNLQLAAYLGCARIALIGFDHSYVVPSRTSMDPVIKSDSVDVNHIHPQYFGPGYRWHDPNVARMERSYRCARHAMEARGVRVINSTTGGHLEVFDRAPLDAFLRDGA